MLGRCNFLVNVDVIKKLTFGPRLERAEGVSHVDIEEKNAENIKKSLEFLKEG